MCAARTWRRTRRGPAARASSSFRARSLPAPPDRFAELITRLERGLEQHFRSKPARIMWAMRDPAFTPAVLEQWRKTLPDAPVTQLDDASHYLQEDAHERIVPQLLSFLAGTSA